MTYQILKNNSDNLVCEFMTARSLCFYCFYGLNIPFVQSLAVLAELENEFLSAVELNDNYVIVKL